MRINKYLKDKGLTTRRGADDLIAKGSVYINGKRAVVGQEVDHTDKIDIRGVKGVREEKLYYIAYNKPIGVLTNNDEKGGKDILSTTNFTDPSGKSIKVFPVGRLDKDSHGLILLTNDGRITDKMLSPRFKHEKEYVVTVDKPFNDLFLKRMESGIRMDGSVTRECQTERVSPNSFKIILTEGKKRQIRRMCEALHYGVVDLYRIRIMNIGINRLDIGEYRHLDDASKKGLLSALYVPMKESISMAVASPKVIKEKQTTAVPVRAPARIKKKSPIAKKENKSRNPYINTNTKARKSRKRSTSKQKNRR
jgi:23S rRNA pseudouridine2604 synthase